MWQNWASKEMPSDTRQSSLQTLNHSYHLPITVITGVWKQIYNRLQTLTVFTMIVSNSVCAVNTRVYIMWSQADEPQVWFAGHFSTNSSVTVELGQIKQTPTGRVTPSSSETSTKRQQMKENIMMALFTVTVCFLSCYWALTQASVCVCTILVLVVKPA